MKIICTSSIDPRGNTLLIKKDSWGETTACINPTWTLLENKEWSIYIEHNISKKVAEILTGTNEPAEIVKQFIENKLNGLTPVRIQKNPLSIVFNDIHSEHFIETELVKKLKKAPMEEVKKILLQELQWDEKEIIPFPPQTTPEHHHRSPEVAQGL